MSQSDLLIPLRALVHDFGTGAGPQSAVAAQLRVKGLHPGKSQERQNNQFSDFCIPTVTPSCVRNLSLDTGVPSNGASVCSSSIKHHGTPTPEREPHGVIQIRMREAVC